MWSPELQRSSDRVEPRSLRTQRALRLDEEDEGRIQGRYRHGRVGGRRCRVWHLILVGGRRCRDWHFILIAAATIPSQVSSSGGVQSSMLEKGSDATTTTDGEERSGTFLHVESLEVVVLYQETSGNQMDLVNFAELCTRGTAAKHEGSFQLSYGGVYDLQALIFVLPRRAHR